MKNYLKVGLIAAVSAAFVASPSVAMAQTNITQNVTFTLTFVSQNTNKLVNIGSKKKPVDNIEESEITTPVDTFYLIKAMYKALGISTAPSKSAKLVRVITFSNVPNAPEAFLTNVVVSNTMGAGTNFYIVNGNDFGTNIVAANFTATNVIVHSNYTGSSMNIDGQLNGDQPFSYFGDNSYFSTPKYTNDILPATTNLVTNGPYAIITNAVPATNFTTNALFFGAQYTPNITNEFASTSTIIATNPTITIPASTIESNTMSFEIVDGDTVTPVNQFFFLNNGDGNTEPGLDFTTEATVQKLTVITNALATEGQTGLGSGMAIMRLEFGNYFNNNNNSHALNSQGAPSFSIQGVVNFTWVATTSLGSGKSAHAFDIDNLSLTDASGFGVTSNGSPAIVTGSMSITGNALK